MTRFLLTLLVFLLLALHSPSPSAGEIDANLAMKLQTGNPGAWYPAVVVLADQVDLVKLDRSLTLGNASRALRHKIVIEALQARATATQGPVMDRITQLETQGDIRKIQRLWILNALLLEGKPRALRWIALDREVAHVQDGDITMALPAPRNASPGDPYLDGPTQGLVTIKADTLWARGITGKGRVVANIDTGVDPSHPALSTRWRGRTVPANQAWYDPITRSTTPYDPPFPMGGHGTHTMGTLCGDDGMGKQIGVAPGATWIAVGMGLTFPPPSPPQMTNFFLQGLQWIADPDGYPGTVTDAPDVVSNSWGLQSVQACDRTLWPAIDACEAAGVAVVFAAGNYQSPTPGSIGIPADRITSPTNAFAVGALNQDGKTIASFSGRGPSKCDNHTIKPEVVAPGVQVESSLPGGQYSKQDGTSMACPHVAGAIALLRQVNPDISATRAKEILMETAVDLGSQGEDNTYGHGLIDLEKAHDKVVNERGVAQVSLVTTTPVIQRPGLIWLHLSATNFTPQSQRVWFRIDLVVNGQPYANLFPPIAPVLPPNFSMNQGPVPIIVPAPKNIPANLIGVPLVFRATLRQGGKEISRADAGFVIS